MKTPSMPKTTQATRPMVTPSDLEGIREQERALQRRRAGYGSTIATRGGLGILNIEKKMGLGV